MRRVTILKYAKKLIIDNKTEYLCNAIKIALKVSCNFSYKFEYKHVYEIFPEFNRKVAIKKFNAIDENLCWWVGKDSRKNRLNFLDYLIDFYKDDETNIEKKFKKYLDK